MNEYGFTNQLTQACVRACRVTYELLDDNDDKLEPGDRESVNEIIRQVEQGVNTLNSIYVKFSVKTRPGKTKKLGTIKLFHKCHICSYKSPKKGNVDRHIIRVHKNYKAETGYDNDCASDCDANAKTVLL